MQASTAATIRPAKDTDAPAIQEIIAAAFSEYPGCVFDMSEMPELYAPATAFAQQGGVIWVAERDGEILGNIAVSPDPNDKLHSWELRKCYLRATARGHGLGRRLIEHAEAYVLERGARRMYLWSDTRFLTAHAVYARCGYVKQPEERDLHDLSNTIEYYFVKELQQPQSSST